MPDGTTKKKHTVLETAQWYIRDIGRAFFPNSLVSPVTMTILGMSQLLFFLFVWTTFTSPVIPKPFEIVAGLQSVFAAGVRDDIESSIVLFLHSMLLTIVISLVASYLTVLPVARPSVGAISRARFLGLTGLTYMFTIMIGGGHSLKVALLTLGMTVFCVQTISDIIVKIPLEDYDEARTLRYSEWRVVWEVVILGRADEVFDVFRQNAAIGWVMLTMVEGIVRSDGGIGAMLLNQNKHLHLNEVFALQFIIFSLGTAQDLLIGFMKNLCCPYAVLEQERK